MVVLPQVRDLKVSSIQPVDTVLCKDQTATLLQLKISLRKF